MTSDLRIGFIPFYVDYYESVDPEFGDSMRRKIVDARNALSQFGSVIGGDHAISNEAEAAAVAAELNEQDLDCVVSLTTIAVFSKITGTALAGFNQPLLLWNRQTIETVGSDYTMVEIVRNTGQIGTQATANVLARQGRRFKVLCAVAGTTTETSGLSKFFRVAQAAKLLNSPSVVMVGSPFAGMTDIDIAPSHRKKIDLSLHSYDSEELTESYLAVSEAEASVEVGRMRTRWLVGNITEEELSRSARLWLAVKSIVSLSKPDCATINSHGLNCLANSEIGVTATYAISCLNEQGIPCSEVGDIPTALALLIGKCIAGDALYTEVQVFDERRAAIVLANSGEAAEGLRREDSPAMLLGNTNFKGVHGRGASFAYPVKAGPTTVFSLTPVGIDEFHLIAMEGEILEEALPDTGAITGFFRPRHLPFREAYEKWMEAGPVHHAATVSGHYADDLKHLAGLKGWIFSEIRKG